MNLEGKRVAVLVGPGFEDLEFWVPVMRLQEAGAEVTVVGIHAGESYASKSGGLTATADAAAADVDAEQVGRRGRARWLGARQASTLPRDHGPGARDVREGQGHRFDLPRRPGFDLGWGRARPSATGSEGIRDDLINAGASWTYDQPAFRDGQLVWGRVVPDIPAFCRELVAALAES